MQGTESQNRSVDGDEVALRILPPCAWWVFKRDQLAAATKAAAEQQEATSRAGFGSASLEVAASPSPICDVGMAEGVSRSFCQVFQGCDWLCVVSGSKWSEQKGNMAAPARPLFLVMQ